jgi:hypothetical protein
MSTQDSQLQAFDGPLSKAVAAILLFGGTLAAYISASRARSKSMKNISEAHNLEWLFWFIVRLPANIHVWISRSILLIATFEFANIMYKYLYPAGSEPRYVVTILNYINTYFRPIAAFAVVLYILFQSRGIEQLLLWATGLVPQWKNTLDWANAGWQVEFEPKDAPIISMQLPEAARVASTVVGELSTKQRSDRLALRPTNLNASVAANVLLFGHVIEEYCAESLHTSYSWSGFYQALSNIASQPNSPLLPERVRNAPRSDALFAAILSMNQFLPNGEEIPNDTALEARIQRAFQILRNNRDGDAANIARGFCGTDYSRILLNSKEFLDSLPMRRQFAKLFIIWGIKENATYPEIFEIPFSRGMFIMLADDGVIILPQDRINLANDRVSICFEYIEKHIIKSTIKYINETNDLTRAAWRETELAEIAARHLNWKWWLTYRIDTQLYADSRTHASTAWKLSGNELVKS